MTQTQRLQLPMLAAGQAQKHVTLNEALIRLDGLVQICVTGQAASAPASPEPDDVFILTAPGAGAWIGGEIGDLAINDLAGWRLAHPSAGWIVYLQSEGTLNLYDGAVWQPIETALGGLGEAALRAVGIATPESLPARADADLRYARMDEDNGWSVQQVFPSVRASGADAALWFGERDGAGSLAWYAASGHARLYVSGLGDAVTVRTSDGRLQTQGAICPGADDTVALGSASLRFSTVYATTGAINTCDATHKTPLETMPSAMLRVGQRLAQMIGVFQWRSAVESKGEDCARLHIGLTAQAVRDVLVEEGLAPERWGLFCRDEADDGDDVLGLRNDQLVLLMIAALSRLSPAPTVS